MTFRGLPAHMKTEPLLAIKIEKWVFVWTLKWFMPSKFSWTVTRQRVLRESVFTE